MMKCSGKIEIIPLGAGQEVGRSCIIVRMDGYVIMLDCGMHMGYNDNRRFPDFSYLKGKYSNLSSVVDVVLVSHFHLDHCGALPYMSEMIGYDGPIYMTHPTRAICPILLEDFRKVVTIKSGTSDNFFTVQMIKDCCKKVHVINLREDHQVTKKNIRIRAYYAGHVIGACMFYVRTPNASFVYTGDYNMTPDRHLGSAWIDQCNPDLLITESTYATTIRDSKRCRESDFLSKVHRCLDEGGKVLIPVFALGRAQELCILLESYWERMKLTYPIYFSTGLISKANLYYKLFILWTSQKIKETFSERNMFDYKHIGAYEHQFADYNGPMVVFATPGMLHAGTSLRIFKKWASSEKNMLIMPGYCVKGTVGQKVLSGEKKVEIEGQMVNVRLQVEYMSFSAHADAKGIMQLIQMCRAKHVLLVHGEATKMNFLKKCIEDEYGVPCYFPANGQYTSINLDYRPIIGLMEKKYISTNQTFSQYTDNFLEGKIKKSLLLTDENEMTPIKIEKKKSDELEEEDDNKVAVSTLSRLLNEITEKKLEEIKENSQKYSQKFFSDNKSGKKSNYGKEIEGMEQMNKIDVNDDDNTIMTMIDNGINKNEINLEDMELYKNCETTNDEKDSVTLYDNLINSTSFDHYWDSFGFPDPIMPNSIDLITTTDGRKSSLKLIPKPIRTFFPETIEENHENFILVCKTNMVNLNYSYNEKMLRNYHKLIPSFCHKPKIGKKFNHQNKFSAFQSIYSSMNVKERNLPKLHGLLEKFLKIFSENNDSDDFLEIFKKEFQPESYVEQILFLWCNQYQSTFSELTDLLFTLIVEQIRSSIKKNREIERNYFTSFYQSINYLEYGKCDENSDVSIDTDDMEKCEDVTQLKVEMMNERNSGETNEKKMKEYQERIEINQMKSEHKRIHKLLNLFSKSSDDSSETETMNESQRELAISICLALYQLEFSEKKRKKKKRITLDVREKKKIINSDDDIDTENETDYYNKFDGNNKNNEKFIKGKSFGLSYKNDFDLELLGKNLFSDQSMRTIFRNLNYQIQSQILHLTYSFLEKDVQPFYDNKIKHDEQMRRLHSELENEMESKENDSIEINGIQYQRVGKIDRNFIDSIHQLRSILIHQYGKEISHDHNVELLHKIVNSKSVELERFALKKIDSLQPEQKLQCSIKNLSRRKHNEKFEKTSPNSTISQDGRSGHRHNHHHHHHRHHRSNNYHNRNNNNSNEMNEEEKMANSSSRRRHSDNENQKDQKKSKEDSKDLSHHHRSHHPKKRSSSYYGKTNYYADSIDEFHFNSDNLSVLQFVTKLLSDERFDDEWESRMERENLIDETIDKLIRNRWKEENDGRFMVEVDSRIKEREMTDDHYQKNLSSFKKLVDNNLKIDNLNKNDEKSNEHFVIDSDLANSLNILQELTRLMEKKNDMEEKRNANMNFTFNSINSIQQMEDELLQQYMLREKLKIFNSLQIAWSIDRNENLNNFFTESELKFINYGKFLPSKIIKKSENFLNNDKLRDNETDEKKSNKKQIMTINEEKRRFNEMHCQHPTIHLMKSKEFVEKFEIGDAHQFNFSQLIEFDLNKLLTFNEEQSNETNDLVDELECLAEQLLVVRLTAMLVFVSRFLKRKNDLSLLYDDGEIVGINLFKSCRIIFSNEKENQFVIHWNQEEWYFADCLIEFFISTISSN
ncbi:hypothetical protein SNEBB_006655 [Seison nebaliae]|nr:hypothetical protein SNEBB_006655 [Seison nebaliae]